MLIYSANLKAGQTFLSPSDAKALLEQCRFPGQKRDLTRTGKLHVANLASTMKSGDWLEGETLPFAIVNGRPLLLNGHHRLGAQVEAGHTARWNVSLHECADMEAAQALYRKFDVVQKGRTNTQIMSAANIFDDLDLSRGVAATLYASAPFIASGFKFDHNQWDDAVKFNPEARIAFMKNYAGEAKTWSDACHGAPSKLRTALQSQGAFSVAMAALKYQPHKAEIFWSGLAKNDGLGRGDPRNAYVTSILGMSGKQTIEYRARQMVLAWNAYFEGRNLSLLRVLNTSEFYIAGTPV